MTLIFYQVFLKEVTKDLILAGFIRENDDNQPIITFGKFKVKLLMKSMI